MKTKTAKLVERAKARAWRTTSVASGTVTGSHQPIFVLLRDLRRKDLASEGRNCKENWASSPSNTAVMSQCLRLSHVDVKLANESGSQRIVNSPACLDDRKERVCDVRSFEGDE
jgi:hypothetical protein